ncbi:hypothetical protein BY458DRAFT_543760 [Sporodiniella umbellata]|nr:hypothetical protein BY458DRAFT_543760 [Sporodiniella umbellata]
MSFSVTYQFSIQAFVDNEVRVVPSMLRPKNPERRSFGTDEDICDNDNTLNLVSSGSIPVRLKCIVKRISADLQMSLSHITYIKTLNIYQVLKKMKQIATDEKDVKVGLVLLSWVMLFHCFHSQFTNFLKNRLLVRDQIARRKGTYLAGCLKLSWPGLSVTKAH